MASALPRPGFPLVDRRGLGLRRHPLFPHLGTGFSQESLWDFTSCLTIVTFLMVFILQNAQNRHERGPAGVQELRRAPPRGRRRRTHIVDLQGTSETNLEKLEEEFEQLANDEQQRRKL